MSDQVYAPFSDDQVASLNTFQGSGAGHPFTCGTEACRGTLVATRNGWHCPGCAYRQPEAWSWMADWSWRREG